MKVSNRPYLLSLEHNVVDIILMKRAFEEGATACEAVFFRKKEEFATFLNKKIQQKKLPSLLILDTHLSKTNEYEILRNIKCVNELKNIPIIIFSSFDSEEERKKTLLLDCSECIEKPNSYQGFKDVLTKVVNKHFLS